MVQRDSVVLVDEYGRDLIDHEGNSVIINKKAAHCSGLLHRAISVYIFNDKNELLLQKRANSKYHSPNKWTNTCCTHPLPEENPCVAARRRLTEEMGLVAALTEVFTLFYKVTVGNGLIENEYDHVFFGISNQDPDPNPIEVSDWNWMKIEKIEKELTKNPGNFTAWFHPCFYQVIKYKFRNKIGVLDDYY
jgi:isopentenyl-diphosphate delta-isomerase